jgi:vacuolar-type H+-ATPase subunit C/Vma6
MNRCDFIDIVFNAGFKPTKEQSKEMLNFACAKGRDVIFEKYISKGLNPTLDDFVLAVEAGCLPIVRFFVEKKFYDVNNVRIVNAVIANDQKVKESEKTVHKLVNLFAEEKFSGEKSTKIVNAVIENEKKTKGKKVFEKTVHEVVKNYLVDRGMQLPSKEADDKYHKAAR